jgi:hypothetical protein
VESRGGGGGGGSSFRDSDNRKGFEEYDAGDDEEIPSSSARRTTTSSHARSSSTTSPPTRKSTAETKTAPTPAPAPVNLFDGWDDDDAGSSALTPPAVTTTATATNKALPTVAPAAPKAAANVFDGESSQLGLFSRLLSPFFFINFAFCFYADFNRLPSVSVPLSYFLVFLPFVPPFVVSYLLLSPFHSLFPLAIESRRSRRRASAAWRRVKWSSRGLRGLTPDPNAHLFESLSIGRY